MTSTKTIIRILQLQRRQSNWKQLQLAKLELSLAQLSPSLFSCIFELLCTYFGHFNDFLAGLLETIFIYMIVLPITVSLDMGKYKQASSDG